MAKNATTSKTKKSKAGKKKLPKSFIITLVVLFVVPFIALEAWYLTTAALVVSGSEMSASELVASKIAKAKEAMHDSLGQQAIDEGFSLDDVDSCTDMEKEYRLSYTTSTSSAISKRLVGLPSTATFKQVSARCVLFAKIVKRMEKVSHHDKHVFVCQGATFTDDDSGRYLIMVDRKGRGIIEAFDNRKRLTKIPRGGHRLIRQWQVFNLGDGCVVIGLSKSGIFAMSGSVNY